MNNFKKLLTILLFLFFGSTSYTLELPVYPSEELAIHEIYKLSDRKNGDADCIIGFKLFHGTNVPQNFPAALKQFLKATEKDHSLSTYLVGKMYELGLGTPVSFKKAVEYIEKSAKLGLPQAQYNLGLIFINGILCERNFHEGVVWTRKAADQGNIDALANLGELARVGIDDFENKIEPDYEKAFGFFKKAAERGSYVGIYNLAQLYQSGLSGEKNEAESKRLFDAILRSQEFNSFILKALMFETGSGVDKDLLQARKYYKISLQIPHNLLAYKGLKRVKEQIAKKEAAAKQAAEELCSTEEPQKPITTKKKSDGKAKKVEVWLEEEPTEVEEDAAAADIDPVGEAIKRMLNKALPYDDQSRITDLNTSTGMIVIENPYDGSVVTIVAHPKKPLTPQAIKRLAKFTYDNRVSHWFGERHQLLQEHSKDNIDRHRFAQRVDEIVQLYGDTAYFIKSDGTLVKNKVLPGRITTKDGHVIDGLFEYAFYKDDFNQKVLYHRFLHHSSKAIAVAPKAAVN